MVFVVISGGGVALDFFLFVSVFVLCFVLLGERLL